MKKLQAYLRLLLIAIVIAAATRFFADLGAEWFPSHAQLAKTVAEWVGGLLLVFLVVIPLLRLFNLLEPKD
jgi:uncharacterized membrane protein